MGVGWGTEGGGDSDPFGINVGKDCGSLNAEEGGIEDGSLGAKGRDTEGDSLGIDGGSVDGDPFGSEGGHGGGTLGAGVGAIVRGEMHDTGIVF